MVEILLSVGASLGTIYALSSVAIAMGLSEPVD